MPHCPMCNGTFPEGKYCPKDGTNLIPDDRSAEDALRDPLVGQVIADRFRIVRRLGAGGMGTVYEAEHTFIAKRVALKLLRGEITCNAEAVARFQREAMSASTIGQQNIVAIDDFGRLPDGQVYLTMEFLEGKPLNHLIMLGPVPLDRLMDIAVQTSQGLAAAHAKGIIHRDMKPENIFLTEGGTRIKILDFGIAKVTRSTDATNLTKTGAIFGTPNYMAPEQALGKKVDHRADIYSLGIILYEMLTGAVPFQSESFLAVLTQHVTKPPVPPSQVAPGRDVPPELEALVLKAIAKEPKDRYQTVDEMRKELLIIQQGFGTELEIETVKEMAAVPKDPTGPAPRPAPDRAMTPAPAPVPAAPLLTATPTSPTPLDTSLPPGPGPAAGVGTGKGGVTATAGELVGARQTQSRRRTGVLLAAAAGVVLLAGAGTVAALYLSGAWPSGLPGSSASATASLGRQPAGPEEPPGLGPSPEERAGPGLQPSSPGQQLPGPPPGHPPSGAAGHGRRVEVILSSIPPQATILIEGRPQGETPEVVHVPRGGIQPLVLRLEGYEDKLLELHGDRDKKVSVRLKARKRQRRPAGLRPRPRPGPRPWVPESDHQGGSDHVGSDHGGSDHGYHEAEEP